MTTAKNAVLLGNNLKIVIYGEACAEKYSLKGAICFEFKQNH